MRDTEYREFRDLKKMDRERTATSPGHGNRIFRQNSKKEEIIVTWI